jgi:hypothetical protein
MSKGIKFAAWDKGFLIFFLLMTPLFWMDDFYFSFKAYKVSQGIEDQSLQYRQDVGKKYTILMVYPSNSLSETQQFMYNCIAARNLGWDCYTLGFNERVLDNKFLGYYISIVQKAINYIINPDFAVYISPHMMPEKLDNIIKFGILDLMQKDIFQYRVNNTLIHESLDWIQNYDGLIIYGDDKNWYKPFFKELKKYYKVTDYIQDGFYPSVFETVFKESPKNKLFYCGYNWDKRRGSEHYKEIYKLLDTKDYFEVYGVKQVWNFMINSYKGLITIAPLEFIDTMQEKGITLVLHSNYHLKYGLPSNRIFEAAAANNVVISDMHPFIEREFGDCVYYVDFNADAKVVAGNIDKIVTHIKSDAKLGNQKAKCIHNVFSKKFTLESQLVRVAGMYEEISKVKKNL